MTIRGSLRGKKFRHGDEAALVAIARGDGDHAFHGTDIRGLNLICPGNLLEPDRPLKWPYNESGRDYPAPTSMKCE